MGNRAVIKFEGSDIGIYLHWNGGVESVLAFLKAAKELGVRDPLCDPPYFTARLVQIIGNFFGGTLSLGVGMADQMDASDNGTFVIGKDFTIVRRNRNGAMTYDDLSDSLKTYSDKVYAAVMERNKGLLAE